VAATDNARGIPLDIRGREKGAAQRLKSQASTEMTTLISSIVVIGKKNLKPGRSTTMSPGSRKSGSRRTQGQSSPISSIAVPRITSKRFTRAF